jgi:hypothetical protein
MKERTVVGALTLHCDFGPVGGEENREVSKYYVAITIEVEPIMHVPPATVWMPFPQAVPDVSHAAGTYVEVENTGEVCTFGAPSSIDPRPEDDPLHLPTAPSIKNCKATIPHSGRNLVLLAVGGGNQIFDRWEGEVWCAGQGARCEVPEPSPALENYGHSVKGSLQGGSKLAIALDQARNRVGQEEDEPVTSEAVAVTRS